MKLRVGKNEGFLAKNPEKGNSIFCYRETGENKTGPYDYINVVTAHEHLGEWKVRGRKAGQSELRNKRCVLSCHVPLTMIPELIRALNELHKDIMGVSVEEADTLVSEEFDTVGEMLQQSGFKDRGR